MRFTKALSIYAIAMVITVLVVASMTYSSSAHAISGTKPPPYIVEPQDVESARGSVWGEW